LECLLVLALQVHLVQQAQQQLVLLAVAIRQAGKVMWEAQDFQVAAAVAE
jgi:hypothetical protein